MNKVLPFFLLLLATSVFAAEIPETCVSLFKSITEEVSHMELKNDSGFTSACIDIFEAHCTDEDLVAFERALTCLGEDKKERGKKCGRILDNEVTEGCNGELKAMAGRHFGAAALCDKGAEAAEKYGYALPEEISTQLACEQMVISVCNFDDMDLLSRCLRSLDSPEQQVDVSELSNTCKVKFGEYKRAASKISEL